jgi:hypothetical protein
MAMESRVRKFLLSDYEGERNVLAPWLDYELTEALKNTDEAELTEGGNFLTVYSPAGLTFRIFVDSGEFDYFEWLLLPTGQKLDYGTSLLRELEYNWDTEQSDLFQLACAEAVEID